MSPSNYIFSNTYGSWLLMRGKPEGVTYMDWSIEGFWKSFWAIVICSPLLLGEWAMNAGGDLPDGSPDASLGMMAIAYVVQWIAYPIVLYFLARPLNMQGSYIPYIISYNWLGVLVMLAQGPIMMLIMMNAATELIMMLYLVVISGIVFALARLAMQVAGASLTTAIGFVVIDLLLGMLIDRVLL